MPFTLVRGLKKLTAVGVGQKAGLQRCSITDPSASNQLRFISLQKLKQEVDNVPSSASGGNQLVGFIAIGNARRLSDQPRQASCPCQYDKLGASVLHTWYAVSGVNHQPRDVMSPMLMKIS